MKVEQYLEGIQGTQELEDLTIQIRTESEQQLARLMKLPQEAVISCLVDAAARYGISEAEAIKLYTAQDTKFTAALVLAFFTMAEAVRYLEAKGVTELGGMSVPPKELMN